LKKSFLTACKKAGIPSGEKQPEGLIFHDLRRTVKTNMLNAGVGHVHPDVILSHSLHRMDAHYMAPSEEDLHRPWRNIPSGLKGKLQVLVKTLTIP